MGFRCVNRISARSSLVVRYLSRFWWSRVCGSAVGSCFAGRTYRCDTVSGVGLFYVVSKLKNLTEAFWAYDVPGGFAGGAFCCGALFFADFCLDHGVKRWNFI